MPPKIRQLKTKLRKAGAFQVSQEGSHTKWRHPLISNMLILSGHDDDDAKPYQEKVVQQLLEQISAAKKESGHE